MSDEPLIDLALDPKVLATVKMVAKSRVPRWIPVGERLPDPHTPVLATDDGGTWVEAKRLSCGEWVNRDGVICFKPTMWFEVPPIPKSEEVSDA